MTRSFIAMTLVLLGCEQPLYECDDPGNDPTLPSCACTEASASPGTSCLEAADPEDPSEAGQLCAEVCTAEQASAG